MQGCAVGHTNCGGTALQLGRPADAAQHFIQALGLIRHLGKVSMLPAILLEVAKLARHRQESETVWTLAGAALSSDGQAGVRLRPHQRETLEELNGWAATRLPAAHLRNARPRAAPALPEAIEAALLFVNGHAVWAVEDGEPQPLRSGS